MRRARSYRKLQELVEEGVLEETGPEEVVITDRYLDVLEKALKGLINRERAGEDLPEDLMKGAVLLSYMEFRGEVSETDLPLKVSLIMSCLEIIQENRLEAWSMITRIRRR
jgi:hypothetical protein